MLNAMFPALSPLCPYHIINMYVNMAAEKDMHSCMTNSVLAAVLGEDEIVGE